MELNELTKKIHQTAVDHGWWEGVETAEDIHQDIGIKLLLAHSEISEAVEDWRTMDSLATLSLVLYTENEQGTGFTKPVGFPTELADTIIRLLDLSEFIGIDIEKVILDKMEYNKTRNYKHGSKSA